MALLVKLALIGAFFLPLAFTPTIKASSVSSTPTFAGVAEGSTKAVETSNEIKSVVDIPVPQGIGPIVLTNFTGNPYPWGWCTYHAYNKHPVPFTANAADWYWEAKAYGLPIGLTPRAGAVMVSMEGDYRGHVSFIEHMNPDGSFQISEMNYWGQPGGGFGRVDFRTIYPGTISIVGYLY